MFPLMVVQGGPSTWVERHLTAIVVVLAACVAVALLLAVL